jgi:hypothetical protein
VDSLPRLTALTPEERSLKVEVSASPEEFLASDAEWTFSPRAEWRSAIIFVVEIRIGAPQLSRTKVVDSSLGGT